MKIIIGGDLAPTESNYSFFMEGNLGALVDEKLLTLLHSADYRIFNLEVPLTDRKLPIVKDGPNLIAPASAVNGIAKLKPLITGLANNHIMDHDDQGLFSTMEKLSEHEIRYVGAGKNLYEASKPLILEKDGIKIGIYACAEHEFSIAGEASAGANPFDPLESLDHIVNLKSACDYVVVLLHGGKEHYRYPSPGLQKVCRKMAEKGADLIVCQHSHCIGAYEKYGKSVIVYGQGNFLFDRKSDEFWNTSVLVSAAFGDELSVDFIPTSKKANGVSLPDPEFSETVLKQFNERSEKIKEAGFIDSEYDKFCKSSALFYLGVFAGFGRILRKIDKVLHGSLTKRIYSMKKLNMMENFIECEAHRELFLRYLAARRKGK